MSVINKSLPSRGAWIEISLSTKRSARIRVAPLAGSVDRNWCVEVAVEKNAESLPARGAWIEIKQI